MVIGSSVRHAWQARGCLLALAIPLLALRLVADDSITKTDGTVITGKIQGVSGGQVKVESVRPNGGTVTQAYYLTDIRLVTMATPPEVSKVQAPNTDPNAVVAALEPITKQYAGLSVQWVIDAMAALGDAYTKLNQTDKALATYTQIGALYPGSPYVHVADASKAQVALDAGKVDDAMKLLQPIIDQADKNLAPSQVDAATYAKAFLVYGKVLVAQKKPQQALEAFLTVKTMFYQNPALVTEAEGDVADVRKNNPNIGVP
jgi:tetratricopeptide (TPR) repeat protein